MPLSIRTYTDPTWLTNTYLVSDDATGSALLVDAGAPISEFIGAIKDEQLDLRGILLTHDHHDHVTALTEWVARFDLDVYAHPLCTGSPVKVIPLQGGEQLSLGGITAQPIPTPGHSGDSLSFLVGGNLIFTGDLLFKGSVGGTNNGSFESLKFSIMDLIMKLPKELGIFPGHGEATSIEEEWETNPFIRAWRGADKTSPTRAQIEGSEIVDLIVLARDYDGEKKAWIKRNGKDEIIAPEQLDMIQ